MSDIVIRVENLSKQRPEALGKMVPKGAVAVLPGSDFVLFREVLYSDDDVTHKISLELRV